MEKYIIGVQAKIAYYYIAESIDEFASFLGDICCKGNKTAANPLNM